VESNWGMEATSLKWKLQSLHAFFWGEVHMLIYFLHASMLLLALPVSWTIQFAWILEELQ